MARKTSLFYDSDIAMLEHEFIKEAEILETTSERMMWYLAGIHDFAEKLIQKICEEDKF